MNYLSENDVDIPRVNAKDVNPDEITERLLQLESKVPSPNYDEKTLPKQTFETLFADDFSGSSGNLEVDNNAVTMLSTATANEAMVEEEEAPIEEVEETAVMDDLQLESPVATPPQAPTAPATGQVTPEQVQALFPNDPTSAAIAQRRRNA